MTARPSDHDNHFMTLALADAAEAREAGDIGVAALVVYDGQIVGRGRNRTASNDDPLAHAETEALTDAYRRIGVQQLAESTLYTTVEPCPMCAGAIHLARIGRVVLGARHKGLGRTDLGGYDLESFARLTEMQVDIVTGVQTLQCEAVRRPG